MKRKSAFICAICGLLLTSAFAGRVVLFHEESGTNGQMPRLAIKVPIATMTTTFSSQATKQITFPNPQPDANYIVIIQPNFDIGAVNHYWPSNRTTNGFTINVSGAVSGSFSILLIDT